MEIGIKIGRKWGSLTTSSMSHTPIGAPGQSAEPDFQGPLECQMGGCRSHLMGQTVGATAEKAMKDVWYWKMFGIKQITSSSPF